MPTSIVVDRSWVSSGWLKKRAWQFASQPSVYSGEQNGRRIAVDDRPAPAPEGRAIWTLSAVLFAAVAVVLARPFFSSLPWTTLVQDDFFYYLVIARNIVHGHGSTFDGIVPTNGYQPLWFVLVLGLTYFTESPHLILAFVAVTTFLSSVATFVLVKRLFASTRVAPSLVFAFSAFVTVASFALCCQGMEVTLTIPIIFGLLCMLQEIEWRAFSPRQAFFLGLLLAAMVLSRIDTFILGALLLVGFLLSPVHRRALQWQTVLPASLGFSPVLAYLAFNKALFGGWLPVSGAAKQLKTDHLPSMLPLHFLLHRPSPVLVVAALVTLVVLAKALPHTIRELTSTQRITFLAAAIYPLVFYGTLSFVSDWRIWPWYWYALRPAICVVCLLLCLWKTSSAILQKPLATWAITGATLAYLFATGWPRQQSDIADAATHIQQFAETHPGIYAMGDRSGQVAYKLHDPLVQLEGLVMDRHYLHYLREQRPLKSVLAAYHVRYYIATEYGLTPCFNAVEPYQAGVHSAHLRSQFCDPPIAVFPEGKLQTVIFDLGPQTEPQTVSQQTAQR